MKIKKLCDECGEELKKVGVIGDRILYQCPKCKAVDLCNAPRLCDAHIIGGLR